MSTGWVLASGSRYRRQVLRDAGIDVAIVEPDFDERSLDDHFADWGVDRYVVEVATGKARSVAGRVEAGAIVVALDQVAVLDGQLLTKPGSEQRAIAELMSMSGRTHELVNGIVALVAPDGLTATAIDRHVVGMRAYTEGEAEAYVRRFRPLDCVGAYRIEDDADLIESVQGSGDDGVIGLPVAVVRRVVAELRSSA